MHTYLLQYEHFINLIELNKTTILCVCLCVSVCAHACVYVWKQRKVNSQKSCILGQTSPILTKSVCLCVHVCVCVVVCVVYNWTINYVFLYFHFPFYPPSSTFFLRSLFSYFSYIFSSPSPSSSVLSGSHLLFFVTTYSRMSVSVYWKMKIF